MSAQLDSLLDAERLADIARNDAAAGIAPPPVEADAEIFARPPFVVVPEPREPGAPA